MSLCELDTSRTVALLIFAVPAAIIAWGAAVSLVIFFVKLARNQ